MAPMPPAARAPAASGTGCGGGTGGGTGGGSGTDAGSGCGTDAGRGQTFSTFPVAHISTAMSDLSRFLRRGNLR